MSELSLGAPLQSSSEESQKSAVFVEHPKKEECQPGDALEGDFCSLWVCGLLLTCCRPSAVKVVVTGEHFSKNTKPVSANRSTSLGAGSRRLLSPRGDRGRTQCPGERCRSTSRDYQNPCQFYQLLVWPFLKFLTCEAWKKKSEMLFVLSKAFRIIQHPTDFALLLRN